MLKLYNHPLSGNCYKVRLLLSMLQIPYDEVFTDVLARQNLTAEFSMISALRQVPVLEDGNEHVWDSQAILVHLAGKYGEHWMPVPGTLEYAHMLQWLAVANNEIGNSLQTMRLYHRFGVAEASHHMGVAASLFDPEGGHRRCQRVLEVMNTRLTGSEWLACARPSVADLACYPYVSMAGEAKVHLDDYPAVTRWLKGVAGLPGFLKITESSAGVDAPLVIGLHRVPQAGLPVESLAELQLIGGVGVEEESYSTGDGCLTDQAAELEVKDTGYVTLFAQEAIETLLGEHGISLGIGEHRCNITTRGVDLNSLVGKNFRIGEATLLGFETMLCEHLKDAIDTPDVTPTPKTAALKARVVAGGHVRVGNRVEVV
jgi:glutathione S-transferase